MPTTQGPIFPFGDPIAGDVLVTPRWRRWFLQFWELANQSAIVIANPVYANQGASIPTTSIDNGAISAGLYSVSWYAAVMVAAGVSSSLTVSLAWVDGGISKSYTGPAMTGNTLSTVQVDQRLTIRVDAASPITIATTYASNPASIMKYDLLPVLQSVATA